MDRLILLVAIALFATVMGVMKYSVAPYISGAFGLVGVIGFVVACIAFAHFVDRGNRAK